VPGVGFVERGTGGEFGAVHRINGTEAYP
jgi:hypothetical protein